MESLTYWSGILWFTGNNNMQGVGKKRKGGVILANRRKHLLNENL